MFSYSLKCFGTSSLWYLRLGFIVFWVFDFIVLFYTSFRAFLVIHIFLVFFLIFVSFDIVLDMAKVTLSKTHEPF